MLAAQAKLEVRPYLSVCRASSHFVACRCTPSHVIVVVVAVLSSSLLCRCRRRLVSVLELVLVLVWPRSSRLIWRHATRTLRHLFFWTTRWSGHGGAFAARRFRNGACIFVFVDDASSSSSFGRPPRACHHHPPQVSSLFPSAFPCAPHPTPPLGSRAPPPPPARYIYPPAGCVVVLSVTPLWLWLWLWLRLWLWSWSWFWLVLGGWWLGAVAVAVLLCFFAHLTRAARWSSSDARRCARPSTSSRAARPTRQAE